MAESGQKVFVIECLNSVENCCCIHVHYNITFLFSTFSKYLEIYLVIFSHILSKKKIILLFQCLESTFFRSFHFALKQYFPKFWPSKTRKKQKVHKKTHKKNSKGLSTTHSEYTFKKANKKEKSEILNNKKYLIFYNISNLLCLESSSSLKFHNTK